MGNTCLTTQYNTTELPINLLPKKSLSQIESPSISAQREFLHLSELIGVIKYQRNYKAGTVFQEVKGILVGDRLVLSPAHILVDCQYACKNFWFYLKLCGSQGTKEQKLKVIKYQICPQYVKSKIPKNDYAIGVLERSITLQNYLPLQRVNQAILYELNFKENNHFYSFPTSASCQCVMKEKDTNLVQSQTQINQLNMLERDQIIKKTGQNLLNNTKISQKIQECLFNEDFLQTINDLISKPKQIETSGFSIQHKSAKILKSNKFISSFKKIQDNPNDINQKTEQKIQLFWKMLEQSHAEIVSTKVPNLYNQLCLQKSKKVLSKPLIELLTKIGQQLRNNQDYEDSLQFYQQSYEAWELLKLQKDCKYAQILFWIGVNLSEMGSYDQALEVFTEQLKILYQSGDSDSKIYASTVNNIGYINCLQGNYQNSIKMFSQAVNLRKKIIKGKDSLLAGYINNLGSAYFHNHDYYMAKCKILSALEIWKELGDIQTLQVAMAHYRLAVIYFQQKMFQKALQLIQNSIKVGKKHRQAFKLAEKLVEFKILMTKISQQYCLRQEVKKLILEIVMDYYRPEEVQQMKKLLEKKKN